MINLKEVSYTDDEGVLRKSLLPENAPEEDAPLGIPVGLGLAGLYPQPFATKLEEALSGRGIIEISDLDSPGVKTVIREEIQRILRYEVHTVIQYLKESNHD